MCSGCAAPESYVLGRRFLDDGFLVRTSYEVVDNRNIDCSIGRTMERYTRWAKLRRAMNPAGFALEPLLQPIAIASPGTVVTAAMPGSERAMGRESAAA